MIVLHPFNLEEKKTSLDGPNPENYLYNENKPEEYDS